MSGFDLYQIDRVDTRNGRHAVDGFWKGLLEKLETAASGEPG